MKLRSNIIAIENWSHDKARRKSRFRCNACSKLVADGSALVIERRGTSSHGYHAECFNGPAAEAALARDAERLAGAI
jgi:hypothetical protein